MAAFCIAVTGLGWMVRIMRGHSDDALALSGRLTADR
jgi:hypothetical protein